MAEARPRVAIARCESYDADKVAAALTEALAPLGGMGAFVSPGQRVLLKPNLLTKAAPDRAITTHPQLLRAVIREVRNAGATDIVMGDSPGGPNTPGIVRGIWDTCGMRQLCDEEGVRLVLPDDDVVRVPAERAKLFAHFNIGREIAEADVVINLPKLKTHGFQAFTGAVKNLFGCIPGLEKPQFHIRVPDRDDFADMLVDLMLAVRPSLSIMDAVVGMEGAGPSGGDPRHIGALIASADPVALDVVASSVAGFDPLEVYTNAAAHKRGLGPAAADDIEIAGASWREIAPKRFAKPVRDITRHFPKWLKGPARQWTSSSPYLEQPSACTGCSTCRRDCPVGAIEMVSARPQFDLGKCIRCYCCQELCPDHAIGLKTPPLVRLAYGRRERKA